MDAYCPAVFYLLHRGNVALLWEINSSAVVGYSKRRNFASDRLKEHDCNWLIACTCSLMWLRSDQDWGQDRIEQKIRNESLITKWRTNVQGNQWEKFPIYPLLPALPVCGLSRSACSPVGLALDFPRYWVGYSLAGWRDPLLDLVFIFQLLLSACYI